MSVPDWVVYPDDEWRVLSPREAGFRQPEFDEILENHHPQPTTFWGERHAPDEFAGVLTRGGYLVHEWGRTKDFKAQTASVGKAFAVALLGLAVEKLKLNPDEPVCRTWTGAGEFSHSHKNFDNPAHKQISWRHLAEHTAGFAIESGYHWRSGEIPAEGWIHEKWTGNPMHDMVSLRAPGQRFYSSAGYVRLGQALTALWGCDLKSVLDRELLGKIGIRPENWHWMTLQEVYENYDLYPAAPGYSHYADAPYKIHGHVVRGAPGWVCMTAQDLARFGLLVASSGQWAGEILLDSRWLISKSGGNDSTVLGDRKSFVAGARIATSGLPDFLWINDFQEYSFPTGLLDPSVTPAPQSSKNKCIPT